MENNKTELGKCDINGFMKVDYGAKHDIGVNNTVVHEFMHHRLVQTTAYGLFLNLLDKVSIIDSKYLKSLDILNYNMIKIQESIATFIEYCSYYKFNDKVKFEDKLEKLKRYNNKYYKYIKTLLFLIDEERIQVDTKIKMAVFLAYAVFDIDLTEINIEIMQDGRKLEKFFSNEENSYKYLPVTRFKILTKELEKYLKEVKDIDYGYIENLISTHNKVPQNKHKTTEEDIIKYIEKLVGNSQYNKAILKLISKMKVVHDDSALSGVAIQSLNLYEQVTISYDEYDNIANNVMIPIVCFFGVHTNNNILVNILSGSCDLKNGLEAIDGIQVNYTSVQNQKNYQIEDFSLDKLLNDTKSIKVMDILSYFAIDKMVNELVQSSGQDLYVYSSIPYNYISLYLKDFITNEYKYRVIQYENFNIIVVLINYNIRVMIPMETISGEKFFDDLATKKCRFQLIGTNDEQPYDEFILRNDEDLRIYDTIVNAYLQTELKGIEK